MSGPRLYGAPDDTDKQGPGEAGLRGEHAIDPDATEGYVRTLPVADGPDIAIEELSGVARAEAMTPGADRAGAQAASDAETRRPGNAEAASDESLQASDPPGYDPHPSE
ncbi:hypothetical protein GCM10011380_21950 [Sphingomonas metalli]|uniref:Uncharacterized protein n=1 Tax=Sphingomonas metalli TaxID=1779358 RepID=A0A916T6A9_9SPHN|nr:hypothetical protein [Sphingomonas metalli]GGB32120.1 hypothetical protein GCM10011380_21950 [Sphingomonas metalli]